MNVCTRSSIVLLVVCFAGGALAKDRPNEQQFKNLQRHISQVNELFATINPEAFLTMLKQLKTDVFTFYRNELKIKYNSANDQRLYDNFSHITHQAQEYIQKLNEGFPKESLEELSYQIQLNLQNFKEQQQEIEQGFSHHFKEYAARLNMIFAKKLLNTINAKIDELWPKKIMTPEEELQEVEKEKWDSDTKIIRLEGIRDRALGNSRNLKLSEDVRDHYLYLSGDIQKQIDALETIK